jgi:CO dehydrogenase nickel-insertion accessory protein CooC1
MSPPATTMDSRQILERLSREGSQGTGEIAVVTSPGAQAAAWAVKVKSLSSYNVYNVIAVVINGAGTAPTEIGQQMQAINLAESFTQPGTLPAGTYAVMARVGDKNVFYAKP